MDDNLPVRSQFNIELDGRRALLERQLKSGQRIFRGMG
jgi:hypothetical protein